MKKKNEIRVILLKNKELLERCKTEIAETAMDIDMPVEEKNKKLLKLQPAYSSYVSVVDVLEDILQVKEGIDEIEED